MSVRLVMAAVLVGALGSGAALAEPQMRPGLWEQATAVKSQSGEMEQMMRQMQQQLASMPAEQRQMMEQMMAAQGMSFDANRQTVRVCVTPEQAARAEVPAQDGNCRQQVVERGGKRIEVTFECAGDPPASGEGEFTFTSPTAYEGTVVVNTVVEGRPERLTMEQTGKWLAAECGQAR